MSETFLVVRRIEGNVINMYIGLHVQYPPYPCKILMASFAHSSRLIRRRHFLSQSWSPDAISRRLSHAVTTLPKYFTTWKRRSNTHKTETILFSKRRHPPSRTLFKSMTLCALDFGSTLFRPCDRLTTYVHSELAHRRQQSHGPSL